jgi:hypothetical protein
MKKLLMFTLFGCVSFYGGAHAAPWSRTTAFTTHMMQTTNPAFNPASAGTPYADYGKVGSTYFPYATPYGLRIGYGLVPTNTELTAGLSVSAAGVRLEDALDAVASALSVYIPANYGGLLFEDLDAELQEVLVDYGFTEGIENIPAALIEATFSADPWKRIGRDMLYVRVKDGLLQPRKNKTFYERFLKPKGY